ncbi:hypothetical protein LTR95_015401 [Oleoguttula sp. CCFEE 5521]
MNISFHVNVYVTGDKYGGFILKAEAHARAVEAVECTADGERPISEDLVQAIRISFTQTPSTDAALRMFFREFCPAHIRELRCQPSFSALLANVPEIAVALVLEGAEDGQPSTAKIWTCCGCNYKMAQDCYQSGLTQHCNCEPVDSNIEDEDFVEYAETSILCALLGRELRYGRTGFLGDAYKNRIRQAEPSHRQRRVRKFKSLDSQLAFDYDWQPRNGVDKIVRLAIALHDICFFWVVDVAYRIPRIRRDAFSVQPSRISPPHSPFRQQPQFLEGQTLRRYARFVAEYAPAGGRGEHSAPETGYEVG